MNLSKRLLAIAELTAPYGRVADIGSDHAYLPVYLLSAGKAAFAVAGEVNPGPLAAAKQTILAAGLGDRIDARLGDGLQVLSPGEVEVAVLAGMGGAMIEAILMESPAVAASLRRLVCQPMNGAAGLREWLLAHGWKLVAEELVLEDGRLYEIMAAEPGIMEVPEPLLLTVGPLLWEQRHLLLGEHLRRLTAKLERECHSMEKSDRAEIVARRARCQAKLQAMEALLRCV